MISQEIAENVIEEHEKINDDMTIGEAQKIENLFDDMSKDLDEELINHAVEKLGYTKGCLLYTSPSPRDLSTSRMPSSA